MTASYSCTRRVTNQKAHRSTATKTRALRTVNSGYVVLPAKGRTSSTRARVLLKVGLCGEKRTAVANFAAEADVAQTKGYT